MRSQFQGKRKIPLVAMDHEISHGRDISWMLRAKQAPEHIREIWIGTSWIVEVMAIGTREGKPFQATYLFLTSRRTTQKPCCNWCATAGAWRAGTGSVTPSCMRMATATGATAPARWPRCPQQPRACSGLQVFSRSGQDYRR